MLENAILNCFQVAKNRNWDKVYWAVDVHGVTIIPNWKEELPMKMYDGAVEALQLITSRKDIELILYTCSWPKEIAQYLKLFESYGIHFNYVNENPDVNNTDYGYYKDKPYFNVLLDDKAGFDPFTDWPLVINILRKIPILEIKNL